MHAGRRARVVGVASVALLTATGCLRVTPVGTEDAERQALVAELAGSGVTQISDVTFDGDPAAFGKVRRNSQSPLLNGVVLSTGKATDLAGPRSSLRSTDFGRPGPTTYQETFDEAALEFSFRSDQPEVRIDYAVATEADLQPGGEDVISITVNGKPCAEGWAPFQMLLSEYEQHSFDPIAEFTTAHDRVTSRITCWVPASTTGPNVLRASVVDGGSGTHDTALILGAGSLSSAPATQAQVTPSDLVVSDPVSAEVTVTLQCTRKLWVGIDAFLSQDLPGGAQATASFGSSVRFNNFYCDTEPSQATIITDSYWEYPLRFVDGPGSLQLQVRPKDWTPFGEDALPAAEPFTVEHPVIFQVAPGD